MPEFIQGNGLSNVTNVRNVSTSQVILKPILKLIPRVVELLATAIVEVPILTSTVVSHWCSLAY
jgi:hypothetical protein